MDSRSDLAVAPPQEAKEPAPLVVLPAPAIAREPFHVDNLSKADWVLEVLGAAEARKEENKKIAAEARRRVDAWLEQANGQEDRDHGFIRAELERFMSTSREAILGVKTEKKSRRLPHGILGWRSSPKRLEVVDRPAFDAWCRGRPAEEGLIRVKLETNHDAAESVAERLSLTPPGTRWVGGEEPGEPYLKPSPPALPVRAQPTILKGENTP